MGPTVRKFYEEMQRGFEAIKAVEAEIAALVKQRADVKRFLDIDAEQAELARLQGEKAGILAEATAERDRMLGQARTESDGILTQAREILSNRRTHFGHHSHGKLWHSPPVGRNSHGRLDSSTGKGRSESAGTV